MADTVVEWSDLRILLALARAGSMVAAAKNLGIQHTTVSRRIDALEEALGVRLIGRARTGVTLTDAGREAMQTAEEMERAHESLLRRVARGARLPEGCVRVSMTDGFSHLVLPRLTALTTRHPTIEVQVQTTSTVVRIEKGEADIGLRMVKPTTPSLVARRITEVGWSLFSSPEYIARRGRPASVDDLAGHDVVGFDPSLDKTPGAVWLAAHDRGTRTVARANTMAALATLLAAGQGVGVVPCFLASGLERLTPEVLAQSTLYAVVHEEQRDLPRVRVVLDHLVEVLLAEQEKLGGVVSASAPRSPRRARGSAR